MTAFIPIFPVFFYRTLRENHKICDFEAPFVLGDYSAKKCKRGYFSWDEHEVVNDTRSRSFLPETAPYVCTYVRCRK